jgi:7-cyano-7-deazaguanine reductase
MKYGEQAIIKNGLEFWKNTASNKYEINITFPEFTCKCPRSGYPDFATIIIKYVPKNKVVELKSLKLYLNSFRDLGISHEEVTNKIYDELKKLEAISLVVTADFNPRGNVHTIITINSDDQK